MATQKLHFETLQLHVGQEHADPASDARAVPIYQTSSYVFHNSAHAAARFGLADPGNIYSRLTNTTQDILEQRIAALEGGVGALAVASGAAPADLDNFEKAIRPETKLLFIETFGNPNGNVIDIEKVAAIAHRHRIPLVVDNTFATPFLLRPIELGADIVVHSATKFIGGHGTTIGGVIVDSGKFDWKASGKFPQFTEPENSYHGIVFADAVGPAAYITRARAILLRDTGATLSPVSCFIFLQGLETLSLRVERHVANALKIVDFLSKHPQVAKVNHPSLPDHPDHATYQKYFPNGGGSIFTFEIKGGKDEAFKFIDSLEIFSLLANVADVKSLVIHPATTTHSQLTEAELTDQGIYQSTIRLSIGTEHVDDLIADLSQAFEKII